MDEDTGGVVTGPEATHCQQVLLTKPQHWAVCWQSHLPDRAASVLAGAGCCGPEESLDQMAKGREHSATSDVGVILWGRHEPQTGQ